MAKKYIRAVYVMVLTVFFLTAAIAYAVLTQNIKHMTKAELRRQSEEVTELIVRQKKEAEKQKEEIYREYIEKARAFAQMIKLKPQIIEDTGELNRIKKLLDVDELHVCDEKGILRWGTVSGYYGFDFAASDEAKVFLSGLTDKDFEMVQEPQISGKGIYFQYITVARYDQPGLVQIGMKPERLEKNIQKLDTPNLLQGVYLGKDERIIIMNSDGSNIIGDSGGVVKSDKFPFVKFDAYKGEAGFITIEGKSYYYLHTQNTKYHIYNLITREKMFRQRNTLMCAIILLSLIIYFIVFFVLHVLTRREPTERVDKFFSSAKDFN